MSEKDPQRIKQVEGYFANTNSKKKILPVDTNSLTKAIQQLVQLKYRGFPMRINTMGVVRPLTKKQVPSNRVWAWVQQVKQSLLQLKIKIVIGIYTTSGSTKGVSDILCCIKGRFVAIEIKNPSTKDKLRESQIWFNSKVEKNGGITIVGSSVEQVDLELSKYFKI